MALFLHLMSWRITLSWDSHPVRPQLGSGASPSSNQGVAGSLVLRWAGNPVDV